MRTSGLEPEWMRYSTASPRSFVSTPQPLWFIFPFFITKFRGIDVIKYGNNNLVSFNLAFHNTRKFLQALSRNDYSILAILSSIILLKYSMYLIKQYFSLLTFKFNVSYWLERIKYYFSLLNLEFQRLLQIWRFLPSLSCFFYFSI